MGEGGANNGFGSHTCGGLFAFGNKERNDKRKAQVRTRLLRGWGAGGDRVVPEEGVSLREQWRNNVQIAVSDAPRGQVRTAGWDLGGQRAFIETTYRTPSKSSNLDHRCNGGYSYI